MRRRYAIGKLQFFWWGTFLRGWLQWGSHGWVCADKDNSICARAFCIGPLEIRWWNEKDWQKYCFTDAEAAAFDAMFDPHSPDSGSEKP